MPTGVYERTEFHAKRVSEGLKKAHKKARRKYKKIDKNQRARMNAGLAEYWKKVNAGEIKRKPQPKKRKKTTVTHEVSKQVDNTILASKRTVRLIVYANNPNSGEIELVENSPVTSMQDALGTIIDYMYSGQVIAEIRLQDYE